MTETIGDYQILDMLGEGAYSKVFKGKNIKTGEIVAVKVIPLDIFGPDQLGPIEAEIRILHSLNHPNIIKLYDVYKANENMYLVMELAEGGELFNKLADGGALSENVARKYFQSLIDSLDHIHSRKTVHRDLKPENILLDKSGNIKLADFGLSTVYVSSIARLATRCGTPNYVAPDVFASEGYAGRPVDIWGAGLILFVMLSAELPFEGDTLEEVIRNVHKAQLDFPDGFPTGARRLIEKIIVSDPTKRATIVEIRQDPWFKIGYVPIQGGPLPSSPFSVRQLSNSSTSSSQKIIVNLTVFEILKKIYDIDVQPLVNGSQPNQSRISFTSSKLNILDTLNKILKDLGATVQPMSDNKIKGVFLIGNSTLTIRIEYSSVVSNLNIIEIYKIRGNQNDFITITQRIKSNL